MAQESVTRPDGARLYYEVYGEGLTNVVLCDGLGCDGFAWKYLLPELAKNHRVVRWHYRGHGKSGLPHDKLNVGMPQNCEDLAAVMKAAKVEKAVLFGHSMGVQVALEFHRCYPDAVEGLVLICGSYGRPLDTFHDTTALRTALPFLSRAAEKFPRVARGLHRLAVTSEIAMEVALSFELNRELLKRGDLVPYFDHLSKMDPIVFLRTLQSLADHTAYDHLPDVDVPTLIVGGGKDKFTPPRLSHLMAEAIPNAELLMVPAGTHCTPLEAPERVGQAVHAFLSGNSLSHGLSPSTDTSRSKKPSASRKKKPVARTSRSAN